MLLSFSVSNFLSFREKTELNMAATRIGRHPDQCREVNGNRLLKGAFIFGANASGKTNLVRAIDFARAVIHIGLDRVNMDKKFFRPDPASADKPGEFEFEFVTGNQIYSYGFAISWSKRSIAEEWLIRNYRDIIFHRYQDDSGATNFEKVKNISGERIFHEYMEDMKAPGMKSSLFLAELARRANGDKFAMFREVFDWFSRLLVIYPGTNYFSPILINSKNKSVDFMVKMLKSFDTGITSIKCKVVDLDTVLLNHPPAMIEKIKTDMQTNLKNDESRTFVKIDDMVLEIWFEDGSLLSEKLFIEHGNPDEMFDIGDESDGTRRLFDILPLLKTPKEGAVVVIDELDRSLHTMAARKYIENFFLFNKDSQSQLVTTAHDTNILDLKLLRQDEIWFMERQKDHSSRLFSLSQFKERFDKDIERQYILGRYGAVPFFNSFHEMEDI